MPKTKPARRRRHPVVDKPHAIVSGAEARGEAAYMVLELLLQQLPQRMCRRVMAEAYVAADSTGVDEIAEEVESLFSGVRFEKPVR